MPPSPPFVARLRVVAVRYERTTGTDVYARVFLRRAGGRDRASFMVHNPEAWHVGQLVELSATQLESNAMLPPLVPADVS